MAQQWSDRIGRRLKLRDLHIMLAVANSGSMGKAASDLAVSQPAISKAIADLEDALGVRLLDRSPQGIEPTIYGRALLGPPSSTTSGKASRKSSSWPIHLPENCR
jgi:hypothetical protein